MVAMPTAKNVHLPAPAVSEMAAAINFHVQTVNASTERLVATWNKIQALVVIEEIPPPVETKAEAP